MSRDSSFTPYRNVGDEPNRRRFGAKRDEEGILGPGATVSPREGGFGHGRSADNEWASKFGRKGAGSREQGAGTAAAAMTATGVAGDVLSAPGMPSYLRAAGAGFRAVANAGAPAAAMPARFRATPTGTEYLKPNGREYGQTTDMGSRFEAAVPGWVGMDKTQRREALMKGGSPTSRGVMVGRETGRSGYVSTSADAAAKIAQKFGGGGSVRSVQDIEREKMLAARDAEDRTFHQRVLKEGFDAVVPPSIGEQRRAEGKMGGAATRFKPSTSAPAPSATPAAPAPIAMPAKPAGSPLFRAGAAVGAAGRNFADNYARGTATLAAVPGVVGTASRRGAGVIAGGVSDFSKGLGVPDPVEAMRRRLGMGARRADKQQLAQQ